MVTDMWQSRSGVYGTLCAGCSVVWAFPMLLFPNKIPVKDEDPATAKRRRMEEGQSVLEKAKGKGRRKDSYNEQS